MVASAGMGGAFAGARNRFQAGQFGRGDHRIVRGNDCKVTMIPGIPARSPKPRKTLADHLVISISPVLIMLLVGSLSFFLIRVFFRGEAVGSVRWVMFWFVMAVVLV